MDTTKEYITMSEKAEEIQRTWSHKHRTSGDWFFHRGLNAAYVVSIIDQDEKDCFWLPRQDQLQEMVIDEFDNSVRAMIFSFKEYIIKTTKPFQENLSMEQLWLAFVMSQLYKKHWDNERKEWVKDG